jgi:hypothetical protein
MSVVPLKLVNEFLEEVLPLIAGPTIKLPGALSPAQKRTIMMFLDRVWLQGQRSALETATMMLQTGSKRRKSGKL